MFQTVGPEFASGFVCGVIALAGVLGAIWTWVGLRQDGGSPSAKVVRGAGCRPEVGLWIVGTFHCEISKDVVAWTFEGAFSSYALALARAKRLGSPSVFIGPTKLDEELPIDDLPWPNIEYPNPRRKPAKPRKRVKK